MSARTIKEETDRISTIIRNLLNFARRSTPQRTSIDLGQVARKTVELLDALAEKRNCSLSLKCVDVPQLAMVDAGQIQQVLSNLIVNALQALPDGGTVHIELDAAHARPPEGSGQAEGDYFQMSVSDEGDGIPEETLPHLFEPFFTTKDIGEGTGLGLSIAYGIVQDHGGWISVTSEPGKGSCFTVFLPQEVQTCADAS